uniref:Integrase catalytic domain-containing protein n=1 Tax=Tanacetum cinerariifolium TaxID=118510 RepID=A0A6L2JWT8_TANCI|nr:hypothetical protein [Tanacetum cinerariifolium]
MMNELIRNQCDVTNHQVNVQFLLQLQPEWQRVNQDNSPRINRSAGYENQRIGNVAGARETIGLTVKPKWVRDAAYHREKMLLCKQEEARIQLNAEQADWRDDTDDELEDQELEAHYMYMAQLQEVSPDAVDFGPIFDAEPLQKVSNDDHYNVFAIESKHPEQSKSIHDTYSIEQDEHNVIIDSLDMSYDREEIDQNDDDNDLANEHELLASLIKKLKCEIDESKNRNKILETSNKVLVEKLKEKLCAHQETISILSQQKEAQIKLYKTREDKQLDKVIALENKIKVLDNVVYKTGQSVQTMNMLNNKCRTILQNLSSSRKLKERILVYSLISQLETQKTQFLNEIDRLSREYYYADHMNAILGVYTELDKDLKAQLQDKGIVISKPTTFSNSFERKDFSKSKSVTQNNVSNDFLKPVTAQTLPPNKKSILKNTNVLAPGMYKLHTELTQTRTSQFPQDSRKTNKRVSFSTGVIPTTSVSRPQLKSNPIRDRVMCNNSQGKKQDVEDQRRNVKLSKNKTSVTACNDSLKAKTLNVNFVCATCGKCVVKEKHDMCVLKSVNGVNSRTKMPIDVPLVEIVLFIVDSGCSKYMMGNLKLLINFVEKFLGTIKFRNDQIASIFGYGDLVQGAVTIKRVYYVEGLNHKLFFVGQFCDADLEVSFWKSTCYIRDLKGNDLLIAWLWHRRLSHLNFDTINLLSKNDIVVGLPKLKFAKDHLCSSCELGKAKRKYTWTHFLRSKDETPEVLIDFLRLVQRGIQAQVRIVRTDKGTKFLNLTLHAYFAAEGILHQTSVARTPEQNGVVKRRN